jgi:hypothetical protein
VARRFLTLLLVCLTLGLGVVGGLGLTRFMLDSQRPFGSRSVGPWISWPRTDNSGGDPYTRAFFARRGDLPLTSVEGLAFHATTDDDGNPLDGSCIYSLSGALPFGRVWTLNHYRPDGSMPDPKLGRTTFTALDAETDTLSPALKIAIGSSPQEGNWLPVESGTPFTLVLRVYDKPISTDGVLRRTDLPRIEKRRCS